MKSLTAGAAFALLLSACTSSPPPAPAPTPVAHVAPAATSAAAAPASSPATVSGPNATPISGDPNTTVCRRDDSPMASHIPKKICHTKAEWAEIDKENKAQLDQITHGLNSVQNTH